jgi:hypothetical protein
MDAALNIAPGWRGRRACAARDEMLVALAIAIGGDSLLDTGDEIQKRMRPPSCSSRGAGSREVCAALADLGHDLGS